MENYWYTKHNKAIEDSIKIKFAKDRVLNRKEFYHTSVYEEIMTFIKDYMYFLGEPIDDEIDEEDEKPIIKNPLLLSQ